MEKSLRQKQDFTAGFWKKILQIRHEILLSFPFSNFQNFKVFSLLCEQISSEIFKKASSDLPSAFTQLRYSSTCHQLSDSRERSFPSMKSENTRRFVYSLLTFVLAGTLAGCSASADAAAGNTDTAAVTDAAAGSTTVTTAADTEIVSGSSAIDTADLFSDRDLEQTADTSDAVTYTVEDDTDITITEEGVYILTGTASNVTVYVQAADDAKVQLVLDDLSITNDSLPAIEVLTADKVFVTTADSESTLSVTGTFTDDGTVHTDAVIFSKSDLVLNGTGTLKISSTANGITSKDDLKVTGGTYDITCTEDALEANDSIAIKDGTFTIDTDKDALHSENEDDNTLGYVYIAGGTFTINAKDDGIQGTTITQIDGGTFDITSSEGIEGTYVQINGGTINISASDDGINAAAKSASYDIVIEINGGDITIVMGSGDTDAVDANGDIYVNGGNINITGNSAFDYDNTGELSGGTVIVNGSQITQMTNSMPGGGMKGGMH
jgi:hypothetical protein